MNQTATSNPTPRIAVIGGGITGLSAAHRLVERATDAKKSISITLFEAGPTLGGSIHTEQRDGFILEHGPDSFITQKPGGLDLCKRLGLSHRLIGTGEEFRRTFIVRRRKLYPVPEGFMLLAPTQFRPFLTSRLFSWHGKLRMGLDLLIPRRNTDGDESLASFVTRRLGREALERVAQPLVSGIYTADPQVLSLQTTMPRFLEMEARHRSIIKAMWKQRKALTQQQRGDSGVRYSMFVALDTGMQSLVEEIESRLPAGSVLRNCPVSSVEWNPTQRAWMLNLADGTSASANGLILALPAYQSAAVLRRTDPALAGELDVIDYASSATINFAYRQDDVPHPLDGFGFVVPAVEVHSIIACTFCHRKFPGRAPQGYVLLRTFLGGALHPHHLDRDDRDMIRGVREDLANLLGIHTEPLFSQIWRHPRSMPQYPVGHLDRVRRIHEQSLRHPHLRIAGNALGGVGIPDCASTAKTAVDALFDDLTA